MMRPGGAFGRGITSKGESVRESRSEAAARARKDRIKIMANKNREAKADDVFSATPGARGRGVEVVEEPLALGGPRDALIEDGHNEDDYIPDVESKGYHVGMVRQPAKRAVDGRGNTVGFVSDHESKFAASPTLADLKAAHNEAESDKGWQADIATMNLPTASEEEARGLKAARASSAKGTKAAKAESNEGTVGAELDEAAASGAGDKQ